MVMFNCYLSVWKLHAQVSVRVFASTKGRIIPHTCVHVRVQNIYLNLWFPTAEINMFSLRRVKNPCCQSISAIDPHDSVIYPIEWRRKCQWMQKLVTYFFPISFTPGLSFTKALNSVATRGGPHRIPAHQIKFMEYCWVLLNDNVLRSAQHYWHPLKRCSITMYSK